MADSRATFTQIRQALDNLAWNIQKAQAVVDGGFTGEGTNTLLYGLRYLVETRLRAWTSDSGIAAVQPPALAALRQLDSIDLPGTQRLLAETLRGIVAGVAQHQGGYDTEEYAGFWSWWDGEKDASPNDKMLGEVAELMLASGLAVDPDHCVPPEHMRLGTVIFSGVKTAAMVALREVNPLLYKGHVSEVYVVARNAIPDEITLTITGAKDEETDSTGDGETEFTVVIPAASGAGAVVDLDQTDDHQLCSLDGATLEVDSGGKADDSFVIRTKRYRAAAV